MTAQRDETEWLTPPEAAELLPYSYATLWRRAEQGFGPKFFERGGTRRYRKRDVLEYIETFMKGGNPPPGGAPNAVADGPDDRAA